MIETEGTLKIRTDGTWVYLGLRIPAIISGGPDKDIGKSITDGMNVLEKYLDENGGKEEYLATRDEWLATYREHERKAVAAANEEKKGPDVLLV